MKKIILVFVMIVSISASVFAGGTQEDLNGVSEDGKPAGYPAKTIEVLLPVNAGASLDLHFRALEASMDLGGPVAIINMGGASQTLGITQAASRPGNGYNIACSAFAGLVIQPHILDLPYTQADFRHIVALNKASGVSMATLPGSDLATFDDLLEKFENGESVTFTTSNAANVSHLAFLSVLNQLNIPPELAIYVSYSGTAEVMTALLGGHVDIAIFDTDFLAEKVESGQMNCIAVLENEPNPKIPGSPSISEYGVTDMDAFAGFLWVAVPKDTPDNIVEWLKQQMNKGLMSETYQDFLATIKKSMTKVATEEEITAALKKASDTYGELINKYIH
ncbi:MAG: tripartite tricarboxylate transporter substrate binding protein [Spirochaetia bacterium]|nr:tripartite tricarboxylate transporter substrate binding protein [Spirochaetia bacterium]